MIGIITTVATSTVIATVDITNPWPPEPQDVTITTVARSDAQLIEVAIAEISLVEVTTAKIRITQ